LRLYHYTFMIRVKHPSKEINVIQEELISSFEVEKRPFQELQLSFGNAAFRYHQKGTALATSLDFDDWIQGLDDPMKKHMIQKGFEQCKNALPFTRHVQERNDLGFDSFVKELMGEEDYNQYISYIEKIKRDI
jgi:hypothetical protein